MSLKKSSWNFGNLEKAKKTWLECPTPSFLHHPTMVIYHCHCILALRLISRLLLGASPQLTLSPTADLALQSDPFLTSFALFCVCPLLSYGSHENVLSHNMTRLWYTSVLLSFGGVMNNKYLNYVNKTLFWFAITLWLRL